MMKEKFELIATTFADDTEIVAFCQKEIAKLDKKAETKKAAAAENESLATQIFEFVGDGGNKTAAEVAEAMGVSNQKASYLLRTMFEEGRLTRKPDGRRYVYSVA